MVATGACAGVDWAPLGTADHASVDLDHLTELVGKFASVPGGLLPALHAVQHHVGHVPTDLIPALADTFNLAVAEVHGVISFYKDFRTTPPAGPLVQVCRAEACASRGAATVWDAAVLAGHQQPVEVDEVFCLGLCTQGPAVLADGHLHVGVTPSVVETIIGSAIRREGAPTDVPTGGDGVTVYVPIDAAARAAGADEVAVAFARHQGVRVVRNGSRGMLWLEPMVEVVTPEGRVGYGNVTAADVGGLIAAGMLEGGEHPSRLGLVDDLQIGRAHV